MASSMGVYLLLLGHLLRFFKLLRPFPQQPRNPFVIDILFVFELAHILMISVK